MNRKKRGFLECRCNDPRKQKELLRKLRQVSITPTIYKAMTKKQEAKMKREKRCPKSLQYDPLILDNMETLQANEFFLREAKKRFLKIRKEK